MEIGDSIWVVYQGKVYRGELTHIRKMIDGASMNERVMITVNSEHSFYLDECDGVSSNPAYARLY